MGRCQIVYVDVIADACAVRRGIVSAEDFDVFTLPKGDLQDEWDEVRFGIVVFAECAVSSGPRCVEVAQGGIAQAVGVRVIGQRVFDDELRKSIRTDRILWMIFGQRDALGIAVSRAGTGKDNA